MGKNGFGVIMTELVLREIISFLTLSFKLTELSKSSDVFLISRQSKVCTFFLESLYNTINKVIQISKQYTLQSRYIFVLLNRNNYLNGIEPRKL